MSAADFAGHTQHARQANHDPEGSSTQGSPRRRRPRNNDENVPPPGVTPQRHIRDDHREALHRNLFQNLPQNLRGAQPQNANCFLIRVCHLLPSWVVFLSTVPQNGSGPMSQYTNWMVRDMSSLSATLIVSCSATGYTSCHSWSSTGSC